MKALSIKQPWASLICTPRQDNPLLGIKDIENRTWRTHFRGKIYIHASASYVKNLETIFTDEQWDKMGEEMRANMVLKNPLARSVEIITID